MGSLFAALGIVALFSVWVFSLKQEIAALHERLAAVAPGSAADSTNRPSAQTPPQRSGLQVWTIE